MSPITESTIVSEGDCIYFAVLEYAFIVQVQTTKSRESGQGQAAKRKLAQNDYDNDSTSKKKKSNNKSVSKDDSSDDDDKRLSKSGYHEPVISGDEDEGIHHLMHAFVM